jgi:hypothetical protein
VGYEWVRATREFRITDEDTVITDDEATTTYTVVTETNGNLFKMYSGALADLAG